jgi:methyl-accepting chemotaxis protein
MEHVQEIDKAIGAHGMWKNRLKQAIDTGNLEISVATIGAKDQCAFGKWLHGTTLSPHDKVSEHYKAVAELHAQFHKVAARVAELATAGKKSEAEKLLGSDSEFVSISTKLTAAMMAWKKSVTATPVR